MSKKIVRLSIALWNESLKRVPYVVIVFLFIIIFQNYANTKSNDQSLKDTKTLIAANNDRANQIKKLSEDNQRISKENQDYIRCIAQIFATYTRDKQPITIKSLDKCRFSSKEQSFSMSSTGESVAESSPQVATSSKPKKNPSKRPDSAPGQTKESIIPFKKSCTIEVFGVCI